MIRIHCCQQPSNSALKYTQLPRGCFSFRIKCGLTVKDAARTVEKNVIENCSAYNLTKSNSVTNVNFVATAAACLLALMNIYATPVHASDARVPLIHFSGPHSCVCVEDPHPQRRCLHSKLILKGLPQEVSGRRFGFYSHKSKFFAQGLIQQTCMFPPLQIIKEEIQDSARMNYEQLIQEHETGQQKRGMFTGDAWMGMMRLQRYNDLLESLREQEKQCTECTRNRRLLEQVWQTVSNEYFDQYGSFSQAQWAGELFKTLEEAGGLLHSKAETYRAAKRMVAQLGDRYSSFLNPEEYRFALHRPIQSELKYLAYQYTGVGMEIGKRHPNGGFEVIAPFAGSPAEEAGILGGERLLEIDGTPVDLLTADEAVTLLRGPVGSQVELKIVDANPYAVPQNIVLERRALPLPPLRMQMIDAGNGHLMAYMRLHYFTHNGTKRMASAIRLGEALGVDGYILDLRNNPGGVFEEAIAMAALWLDCKDCDITETVRSNGTDIDDFVYIAGNLPQSIFLNHPGVLTHAPLLIISNRNSASASEVLIGALQDNQRTTVIGERTFGKGVVQYYFPMDDGSGLKLTVAKYLTPKRYDISKKGGLSPHKYCGDFPHAKGISDICIDEAVKELLSIADFERKESLRTGSAIPAPMPYRWLPFRSGTFLNSKSY